MQSPGSKSATTIRWQVEAIFIAEQIIEGNQLYKQRRRPNQSIRAEVAAQVAQVAQETKVGSTDHVPEMLSTADAAYALRLTPQTLRKWASVGGGLVRPVKVGRRLMWSLKDIEAVLNSRAFRRRPQIANDPTYKAAPTPSSVWDKHEHRFKTITDADRDFGFPEWYFAENKPVVTHYSRGDLIEDAKLKCAPYKIERVLIDQDTQARFYLLRRIDLNGSLLRSHEVVDDPLFFRRYVDE